MLAIAGAGKKIVASKGAQTWAAGVGGTAEG